MQDLDWPVVTVKVVFSVELFFQLLFEVTFSSSWLDIDGI